MISTPLGTTWHASHATLSHLITRTGCKNSLSRRVGTCILYMTGVFTGENRRLDRYRHTSHLFSSHFSEESQYFARSFRCRLAEQTNAYGSGMYSRMAMTRSGCDASRFRSQGTAREDGILTARWRLGCCVASQDVGMSRLQNLMHGGKGVAKVFNRGTATHIKCFVDRVVMFRLGEDWHCQMQGLRSEPKRALIHVAAVPVDWLLRQLRIALPMRSPRHCQAPLKLNWITPPPHRLCARVVLGTVQ